MEKSSRPQDKVQVNHDQTEPNALFEKLILFQKKDQVLPRFELGLLDSKSKVIAITPQNQMFTDCFRPYTNRIEVFGKIQKPEGVDPIKTKSSSVSFDILLIILTTIILNKDFLVQLTADSRCVRLFDEKRFTYIKFIGPQHKVYINVSTAAFLTRTFCRSEVFAQRKVKFALGEMKDYLAIRGITLL